MKKKTFLCLLALILVIGLTLVYFQKPAHSKEVIKWRGQTFSSSKVAPYGPFGPDQTGMWGGVKQWTDMLTKRTGGRLVIEWAEPGAIFPLTETDKAVGQGVVQICYTYSGYFSGRIPEVEIETGGIFLFPEESLFYECLFKYGLFNALQKVYAKHNIYWLPGENGAIVGIGTMFPAPNPESIKGKKIRTVGIWGDYISLLGGTPVATPWGDVYMAAKLGTIDGWGGGVASLEELKLKEVAKGYVVHPNITNASTAFLIHKPAYEKLPKDIQDILQNEASHWSYITSTHWHNQCLWAIRNSELQYGVKAYYWSPEDVDRISKQVIEKIYPKISAKSPDCAELMKIVMKQMRDYGRIK